MILLALTLFLSGVAGLSYEVVWLRLAAHAVGSSSAATALTLSVFMGGMAAGARVLGRRVDRAQQPLYWFVGCEFGLAICAFVIPQLFFLVAGFDRTLGASLPSAAASVGRGMITAAIFLPPTFLMGGTLPAIAAHLARRTLHSERGFVLLYAIHVFGAVLGCLLASFVAIPGLGLERSSALGAIFNAASALLALGVARRAARVPAGAAVPSRGQEHSSPRVPVLPLFACSALAFGSGFLLLGSEVVFVRMLVMSLSAKVHSFALMLATFLLGLSLASALASVLPIERRPRGLLAGALAATTLALLLARESVLRGAPYLLKRAMEDGAIAPREYLLLVLAICAVSLLPVAFCAGTILPFVLRLAGFGADSAETGRRVGRVLSWNTLGAVSGPLVFTWAIVPRAGLLGALYVAAWAAAVAALCLIVPSLGRIRVLVPVGLTSILVTSALLLVQPHFGGTSALDATLFVEREIVGQVVPTILHHREGSTATVTITTRDGRPTIRLDGFEAAGVPGDGTQAYQYMRLLAHLPVLLRPTEGLHRGLVICCGTGTTAGSLCSHPFESVDLVDLHPEVLDCLPYFREANRDLARDPRCTKIATDGRVHLRRTASRYDVVTLEPMPPQYAGMTQLYSEEFYRDCARVMREGAVVAQWLPYHLVDRTQALAIVAAIKQVFDAVQVWEHRQTGIVIARKGAELQADARRFEEARALPAVRADLEAAEIRDFSTFLDGFLCDAGALDLASVTPIRDDHPDLEYRVFGFGLLSYEQAQIAEIREPFFRARLETVPQLSGVEEPERRALLTAWRGNSLARYASYLRARGDPNKAMDLLENAVRAEPDLRSHPTIRLLLEPSIHR